MAHPPTPRHDRFVRAPQLQETAEIWWDSDAEPLVTWDVDGCRFLLVDGEDPANTLHLWTVATPTDDPRAIAAALAEGLAACDFPPTAAGVSLQRAALTLRVANLPHDPDA